MADPFDIDLGDETLGELGERNDFLKRQTKGASKAAKATKGAGTNKDDDLARELSQKQIAVESEIFDRLENVHESRSKTARIADESKRAERADSPMQWKNNPAEYDWPGLDTPK